MYITWRAVAFSALGLVPALLTMSPSIAWAWALLTALAVLIDVAGAPSPRSVAVARSAPASVRLTEPTQSTLFLANTGRRRVRGLVRDAWQPSAGAVRNRHRFDLATRERSRHNTPMMPVRRGDLSAGAITLRLAGPLGLAGRQLSIQVPAVLRVLPEFASRRHLPSRLIRLRELDGRSAVQIRGAGSEFDSLREYVVGDDVRSIDWRATARRTETVVRTWRPERDRQVVIVLDTSRTAAARIGATPRLDASIEATLLLSALAGHAGDRVQVVAYDRQVRARVAGAAGPSFMPKLAERLAPIHPALLEMDWIGVVRTVRELTSQRALVVLLTSVDPGAAESGLLRAVTALSKSHQVLVGSVEDPEINAMADARGSVDDVYGAAAAMRYDLERQAIALRLRRSRAEVVSRDPEGLAPGIADAYLALKAAGRL